MIEVQNVSFVVDKAMLVNDVSLQVAAGEFVVIMGANGAGKSTLLKMMSGSQKPTSGAILFKQKNITQYTTEALATQRAVLSQHYEISFPMCARDIVMIGRYPYFKDRPTAIDEEIVNEALEKMQVLHLAARDYHTLSGGEAQKVQMSRVLAQIGVTDASKEKLLLLDEPVSHLDIKYQHQLLNKAKELCNAPVAVVAVLHDVNLALKYADVILFMKGGRLIHTLHKNEQINAALLKDVFDVDAQVFDVPGGTGKFVAY